MALRTLREAIKRAEWRGRKARERRNLCWIGSEHAGQMPDKDYCPRCCGEVVAALNYFDVPPSGGKRTRPDSRFYTDGDWNMPHEEDGHRFCDICDAPLHVALTSYGSESELEEFEKDPPDGPESWRDWLDVLNALNYSSADKTLVKRAIAITNRGS